MTFQENPDFCTTINNPEFRISSQNVLNSLLEVSGYLQIYPPHPASAIPSSWIVEKKKKSVCTRQNKDGVKFHLQLPRKSSTIMFPVINQLHQSDHIDHNI